MLKTSTLRSQKQIFKCLFLITYVNEERTAKTPAWLRGCSRLQVLVINLTPFEPLRSKDWVALGSLIIF